MHNFLFFIAIVLIGGSGWFPIKVQAQTASADISILYRHLIVSAVLLAWCFFAKKNLRFSLKDHFFFAVLGATMFSFHYIFIYEAAHYLISGILAVLYSSTSFFNVLNNYIFFRTRPTRNEIIGILIGLVGLCVFFSKTLSGFTLQDETFRGILLVFLAASIFSLGNTTSKRNTKQGINPLISITMAALYGTTFITIFMGVTGAPFSPPADTSFWLATLYLAIPGTIIGYWCLMKLIHNVGPNKAGYVIICFPIVALTISSFVENYVWTRTNFAGFVLILLGSIFLVNRKWQPGFFRAPKGS